MARHFLLSLACASALLVQGCAQPTGAKTADVPVAPPLKPAVSAAPTQSWERFLDGLRAEALAAGISAGTVKSALGAVVHQDRAVDLDQRQPEFNKTLGGYFQNAVPESRVAMARQMLAQNAQLLSRIQARYPVPANYLVAFWGLETNFGGHLGDFPIIDTLATLAYEGRRGAFFRGELMNALRIIDAGHVSADRMVGSWAGAMGQTQFMPSTFLAHAVDFDGDGRVNPWGSTADALASGAKYLMDLGWKPGEPWGREVRLPAGFDLGLTGIDEKRSLADWAALGVRGADGSALPADPGAMGAIILPAGYEGPVFLVQDNYFVILHWNRSLLYALAVGNLADRAAGGAGLVVAPPAGDRPLRVSEVKEIQEYLNRLGHDAGTPDGLVGAQTRLAVRRYQMTRGLPADGYADADLLTDLRTRVGG
jgi:membrane-bound lytic murein transglycosylase B